MRSDRKRTILFIIILLVMSMGIGYAFLTTTLNIDGTSDIYSASWDVHFENAEEFTGDGFDGGYFINQSIPNDQILIPATIESNGLSIDFHVRLKEPGERYTFTVDAVNAGTINAEVESINYYLNGTNINDITDPPVFLQFGLGYFDNSNPVSVGDYLKAGSSRKMLFALNYGPIASAEELPSTSQSIDIEIVVTYKQSGQTNYIYSFSDYKNYALYSWLPAGMALYDDYLSAINASGYKAFIRYELYNNALIDVSLGFVYNNQDYYLTSDQSLSEKKMFLQDLFGNSNCEEVPSYYFRCTDSIVSVELDYENSHIPGEISAYEGVNGCYIYNGSINCGSSLG